MGNDVSALRCRVPPDVVGLIMGRVRGLEMRNSPKDHKVSGPADTHLSIYTLTHGTLLGGKAQPQDP